MGGARTTSSFDFGLRAVRLSETSAIESNLGMVTYCKFLSADVRMTYRKRQRLGPTRVSKT